MKLKFLKAIVVGAALVVSSLANAGIIHDVQNGKLMGASGIDINGALYSVSFVDGSCNTAYAGCDETLFDFTDSQSATDAFNALIDQVFIDNVVIAGVEYDFDSIPTLTNGCEYNSFCEIWVPFSKSTDTSHKSRWGYNRSNTSTDAIYQNIYTANNSYEGSYMTYTNFVREEIGQVPEPSTLAIFSLGIMGLASRRFKKQA